LYDIDGDGVNELLLGSDHMLPEHLDDIWFSDVHKIQNGVAVQQKLDVDYWVSAILFENGTIGVKFKFAGSGLENVFESIYYCFGNGELKLQDEIRDQDGKYFRWILSVYPLEDPLEPLTKQQYDALVKKYEGNGKVVELDWKPVAEYGR
jgi:hypothetical protein